MEFAPLGNPYQPFITGAAEASAIGSGHLLNQLRYGLRQRRYVTDGLHEDAWRAAQGADAIIYKYPWITGYTVAEKLEVPSAPAMLLPLVPTRAFPSFMLGRGTDRGRFANWVVWNVPNQLVWQGLLWDDAQLRRKLGLRRLPTRRPRPPMQSAEMPVFCPWSPAVLARPADWPEAMHVTGYWFLDPLHDWRPPADIIVRFLDDGPPPVSVGFGSMASGDRQATVELVLRALELSGQRGCFSVAGERLAPIVTFPAMSSVPRRSRTVGSSHAWPPWSTTAVLAPPAPHFAAECRRS